ncbi:MAG: EAL domain-containing protein [Microthrixaceae bacterium]|nr:EAL domain-containing protein [Microthrixaceae bacterium]
MTAVGMPLIKRSKAQAALDDLRSAYDASIAEAGLVLLQQTAAGADSHHVSQSCLDVLGWEPTAFLAAGTLRSIVHVDDLALFRTAATDPHGEAPVIRLRRPDGAYGHFRFGVTARGISDPLTYCVLDVSRDAKARTARARAAEILDTSESAILVMSLADLRDPASLVVESLNPAAARLLRSDSPATLDELFSGNTLQLLHSAAFDVAHTGERLAFTRLSLGEFPNQLLDVGLSRLADGTISMHLDDVTMQASIEQRLRDRALYDQSTGLPNLAFLEDHLTDLAHGGGASVGMLVIELAGSPGDRPVVTEVAQRLSDLAPGASLLARLGEQRLALAIDSLSCEEELSVITQSATAAMAVPFDIAGEAVSVQAVVGAAASSPSDARATLLRDAEDALRRAIAQHRPWVIGSAEDRVAPSGLFHDVREGVGHGRMELRYQPLLDLRTGRITKVEALLRWADGDRLSDASLELAERSGIPDVLPRWVIGEAAGAARWLADSGFDQTVAINLANGSAVDGIDGLIGLLAAEGLFTHGRLEVEIPESLITQDPMSATGDDRGPAEPRDDGGDRRFRRRLHLAVRRVGSGYRLIEDRSELHSHHDLHPCGRGSGAIHHRAVSPDRHRGHRAGCRGLRHPRVAEDHGLRLGAGFGCVRAGLPRGAPDAHRGHPTQPRLTHRELRRHTHLRHPTKTGAAPLMAQIVSSAAEAVAMIRPTTGSGWAWGLRTRRGSCMHSGNATTGSTSRWPAPC